MPISMLSIYLVLFGSSAISQWEKAFDPNDLEWTYSYIDGAIWL